MIPIRCTCGNLLGNLQIPYETKIKNYCDKHNIQYNEFSSSSDAVISDERSKFILSLVSKPCCVLNFLTTIDLVEIVT
jgi:DNA-directed RNA polymerase subunit N (RpoN/RPB10)